MTDFSTSQTGFREISDSTISPIRETRGLWEEWVLRNIIITPCHPLFFLYSCYFYQPINNVKAILRNVWACFINLWNCHTLSSIIISKHLLFLLGYQHNIMAYGLFKIMSSNFILTAFPWWQHHLWQWSQDSEWPWTPASSCIRQGKKTPRRATDDSTEFGW